MNLQLHFAQKLIKKSLKLAEIDLFHSNAKIGFFWQKKTKSKKSRPHALKNTVLDYKKGSKFKNNITFRKFGG